MQDFENDMETPMTEEVLTEEFRDFSVEEQHNQPQDVQQFDDSNYSNQPQYDPHAFNSTHQQPFNNYEQAYPQEQYPYYDYNQNYDAYYQQMSYPPMDTYNQQQQYDYSSYQAMDANYYGNPEFDYNYGYPYQSDPYYGDAASYAEGQQQQKPKKKIVLPHNQPKKNFKFVKTKPTVSAKKPKDTYVPLSQSKEPESVPTSTESEKIPRQQQKPKKRVSLVPDNAIRMHAKDSVALNPKGKIRQLYADQEGSNNQLYRISDEPIY